jgi:hypothetical protein
MSYLQREFIDALARLEISICRQPAADKLQISDTLVAFITIPLSSGEKGFLGSHNNKSNQIIPRSPHNRPKNAKTTKGTQHVLQFVTLI